MAVPTVAAPCRCGCAKCAGAHRDDWPAAAFQSVVDEADIEFDQEAPSPLSAGLSPLARRSKLHPGKGNRTSPWSAQVYGLVVHTTGGSLPGKARAAGRRPDEYAVQYYLGSGGTHYVNGWDGIDGGQLHQVMNELRVAWGVGRDKTNPQTDQWKSVAAGRFERDLPPAVLRLWRARWPGVATSLDLLPVRSSANLTYVHVECVPCVYHRASKTGAAPDPLPMREGLRFTKAQHETVARLAWDIAGRHGWPRERWWRTPRLVGHEDLTPLARHDKNGGWDPGGLRDKPYFDWPFVYDMLERLSGGATPTTPAVPTDDRSGNPVARLLGVFAGTFSNLVRAGREIAAITEAMQRGQTDPRTLTNLVFFARHPELNGRRIRPDERHLAQEWIHIRDQLVRPALSRVQGGTVAPAPSAPGGTGIPPLGGPKVPPGFKAKPRGLAKYSNIRLDAKLLALRRAKAIAISDQDIDTLQRIANVEAMGTIQALNTWDTGVVSIGFMQWTLLWGELQKWILRAPAAFARYGIAVDRGRTWTFKAKQFAIVGASHADELRWNGWAQRFYLAGLDDEIIVAEVQRSLEILQEKLDRMRGKFQRPADFAIFKRHYDSSPELRAIFQEAYNNRPVAAIEATKAAVRGASGATPTAQFLSTYKHAVTTAFANQGKSASHLLQGTATGARLSV